MTNRTEKTYRVADITAEDIKKVKDDQNTHTEPDAGKYYNATVFVKSTPYSKDWSREDFDDCPEVKQWIKDGGMEDWPEEDIAGDVVGGEEVWEAFERSATYLKGLEDIVDDIKKDFAPDAIVTIE